MSRYINKIQQIFDFREVSFKEKLPSHILYKLVPNEDSFALELNEKIILKNKDDHGNYFATQRYSSGKDKIIIFIDLIDLFKQDSSTDKKNKYGLIWNLFDWIRQVMLSTQNEGLHFYFITYDNALHCRYDFKENNLTKTIEPSILNSASISGMLKTLSIENSPTSAGIISSREGKHEFKKCLHHIWTSKICCEELLVDNNILYSTYFEEEATNLYINNIPDTSKKEWIVSIGGGQGIGLEVLKTLHTNYKNVLLIGSTPLQKPKWFNSSCTSKLEIRNTIIEELKLQRKRVTPVNINKEERKLTKNTKLLQNLATLKKYFDTVDYIQSNITDFHATELILDYIEDNNIKPDLILGVAGTIRDSLARNKKKEDFELVIDTKLSTYNLGRELHTLNPKASLIYFTSVASKTGNIGQVDYAIANEFVNYGSNLLKLSNKEGNYHAINWGPWKDTGMASKDVINNFTQRGVYPIPLKDGAKYVELLACNKAGDNTEQIVGIYDANQNKEVISSIYSSLIKYPYLHDNSFSIKTISTSEMEGMFQISTDKPYLKGHQKFGYPVLSAAVTTRYIYELINLWMDTRNIAINSLKIESKVLNGIVCKGNSLTINFKVTEIDKTISVEIYTYNDNHIKIIRYKALAKIINQNNINQVQIKKSNQMEILSTKQAYKELLFHDAIYKCILPDIEIYRDSKTAYAKIKASKIKDQLNSLDNVNYGFDPISVDAILQLALILTQKIYNTSTLPAELRLIIYESNYSDDDIYDCYSRLSDFSEKTNTLMIEGGIYKNNKPIVEILKSKLVHSKSLSSDKKLLNVQGQV